MYQIRIVLFVLLLLNSLSDNLFAQTKLFSKKEIRKLTDQASQYLKDANFEKSLESSKLALHHSISTNNSYYTTISYNTIAANYAELAEFDKAIFFYNKGLFYANRTNNDTLKHHINNNLGNIYCFEKKTIRKRNKLL